MTRRPLAGGAPKASVPAISLKVLADAAIAVGRMDINARVQLADEIFARQPNLLASVLVQQRMGSSLQQLEVLLTGSCLHASLIIVMMVQRFGRAGAVVRGGADGVGACDAAGHWRGHYWVEVLMPSGVAFVVDVTADQFGHDAVIASRRRTAGETGPV